jgi:hypothetical protein
MNKDNSWLLFYNGTGIEMPFKFNSKDKLIKCAEDSIIEGLKCGVSIETQKENILFDLNEMESFMLKTFKDKKYNGEDLKNILGQDEFIKFCTKWLINVVSALKLKIINDDNNNGHLIIM